MGCWRSLTRILLLLLSLSSYCKAGRNVKSNVCKWCDNTYPICEEKVCYTNCDLSSYCEKPDEICVSIWKQDNESIRVTTLCHNPQLPVENVMVPNYNTSQCVMARQHNEDGILYVCGCVNEQECNDKLIFKNHTNGYSMLQSKEIIPVAAISLLPPLLVAIMITVVFYLCRTHKQRTRSKDWAQKQSQRHTLAKPSRATSYDDILSVKTDHHSRLSSACANSINHNTELLPIELDERVGKGQFAEVWRAKLKHTSSGQYETVAIKIFPCEEYASWRNESRIFADANLKHDGVLQFLTAEERHSGLQKEYWLITAYHSQGNLKDYLTRHVLSWRDLQKVAGSLVSGVAHLHSDYTACGSPKIPIAHRDIKSTNILIKNEKECVLCDFGIALRLDPSLSVEDFANSGQGMHFLCDTITECWDHDPEARLTAHCVAERFNLMAQTDCDDILNNNNTDNEARKMGCRVDENQENERNSQ
ncbi:TGF-beta receptor type-2-like isoform X2 [Hemicordylus capensis]|uniref:TGF-beta receptor type-2-like isoform X2 n=1 Tax=Hemicordylus capensis TaxID=884348 RepID=UPI0023029096|nr:TGF-beta receptor type-2-like isoform X2 [Hemicordylus capensis]